MPNFWHLPISPILTIQSFPLIMLIFRQKSFQFCTPRLKTWQPYWAYSQGDCEDHFKRMKDVQKEVTGVIKINSLFNIFHILPITYLGNYLLFHSQYLNNISEAYKQNWSFPVSALFRLEAPNLKRAETGKLQFCL